jgi:hypothetical protein
MKPSELPYEVDKVGGNVGGQHCDFWALKDANGKIIVDTLNSDVAVIREEPDEGFVRRYDEQGLADLEFIKKACNHHQELFEILVSLFQLKITGIKIPAELEKKAKDLFDRIAN